MINNNPSASAFRCYAIKDRELALRADGQELDFADLLAIREACGGTDLFEEAGNEICALAIENKEALPAAYKLVLMREYFYGHTEQEAMLASRAKALISWRQNTKFCSKCGAMLQKHEGLTARVCPNCGQVVFPRIDPCIIVLVKRDGKILLARHVQRNQDIYACIAGFIEAGETVEHAVEREILEETGLKVKNIRYFGSQSWPFPSQLMLGFTAEWESGEIKVQEEEISDAQWFDPHHCPASPAPGSIAYRLIESAK